MCRKHEPRPLYAKPDAATQPDLMLSYILRGLDGWFVCGACGLTGTVGASGVRWSTKGTVGYLDREKKMQKAAEWNAKVEGVRQSFDAGSGCNAHGPVKSRTVPNDRRCPVRPFCPE